MQDLDVNAARSHVTPIAHLTQDYKQELKQRVFQDCIPQDWKRETYLINV